jgi:hypothetical protein
MAYDSSKIPNEDIEVLARHFLPYVLAFYESEEGRKEYEEWEKQQSENNSD